MEIPKKMRALVKRTDEMSYLLEEIDVPEPDTGEVLIKVEYNGLCGSDIALYKWDEAGKVTLHGGGRGWEGVSTIAVDTLLPVRRTLV